MNRDYEFELEHDEYTLRSSTSDRGTAWW